MARPVEPFHFDPPKYVRRVNGSWEYGHVECAFKEGFKNKYVKRGTKPTHQEALLANGMAQAGCEGHSRGEMR